MAYPPPGWGGLPPPRMMFPGAPPPLMGMAGAMPMPGMVQHMGGPRPMMQHMRGPRPNGMPRTGALDAKITMFVGNINSNVPDAVMREILQKCGRVINWQRVKGAAFGFCDFQTPEGAKRALRVLKELKISGKELRVTVDEKNQKILDDFEEERQRMRDDAPVDDEQTAKDQAEQEDSDAKLRAEVEEVVSQHGLNVVAEEEKKEETKPSHSDKDKERDRDHKDRDREKDRSSDRDRDRDRGRDREKDAAEKERRMRKELESAYRDRERHIDEMDKRRLKDIRRDAEKDIEKAIEREKETARLFEFFATYDDDEHDSRYYSSHIMKQKRKEREHELNSDARDREREADEERLRQEREAIRLQKLAEEERDRLELEEKHARRVAVERDLQDQSKRLNDESKRQQQDRDKSVIEAVLHKSDVSQTQTPDISTPAEVNTPVVDSAADGPIGLTRKRPASAKPVTKMVKPSSVALFGGDSDHEDVDTGTKRKKLHVIKFNAEDLLNAGWTPEQVQEDKNKRIKALVDKIPSEKGKLYTFEADWTLATPSFFETKIQPWVGKKIAEYIGEEEPSLVEFILEQIKSRKNPAEITENLTQILDDEADVFVQKMTRLCITQLELMRWGLA